MAIKVLHLCSEKTWRGGEQQIAYLIEELNKYNIESIVALRDDSALKDYCVRGGIRYVTLPFSNSIDLYSAKLLKKISEDEKVQLIHMHTSKSHGIGVLSARLGNTCPLILSRRVAYEPKSNFLTAWKYNHPSIKRIICVSKRVAGVMHRFIKDKDKCVTIYDGIDMNKFQKGRSDNFLKKEYHVPSGKILIGNTAALAREKDFFTFIDTIEILVTKRFNIHAFVVGEGPQEQELKEYVVRKGLQHAVTFTGFRKDITEVLQCFDLFLMTSRKEGLGSSILDAFLAGIPVVATSTGGIPELVRHEETGLLAGVGNAEQLAENVMKVLQNEDLKARLVYNASLEVKKFSKAITAHQTLEEYKKVLVSSS